MGDQERTKFQPLHSLTMFYNTLTKNLNTHLDFESSFESAGKEASEWTNQRCKCGKSDAVDLERTHAHCFLKRFKKKRKGVGASCMRNVSEHAT